MRKFRPLMLLAVAAMVACEKSEINTQPTGNEEALSVNLSAQSSTRALDDTNEGAELTYYLQVFWKGELYSDLGSNNDGQFNIRLVTEQDFTLVAWADYDDSNKFDYYNTKDLRAVTINTDNYEINTLNRDAFTLAKEVRLTATTDIDMVLTRQFSRINIQTLDIDYITADIYLPTDVKLIYPAIYTTFNALTGLVDESVTDAKSTSATAVIDSEGALSADYLFVPADGVLINFEAEIYNGTDLIVSVPLSNIPIKANYQTNISGNLLTDQANINVEISPYWDGDIDSPQGDDPEDKYANYVETTFADIKNGNYPEGDFWLITDEAMPEPTWLGMQGTITVDNLGDRRISIYCPNYSGELTQYAFYMCDALIAVDIPKATSIATEAFDLCTALESIYFPEVTSVGYQSFRDCSALTSIDSSSMPKVESAGDYAFSYCDALLSVDLPLLSTTGTHLFYYCSLLESVNLPELESVGNYQFGLCEKLKSVNLPKVLRVDEKGFAGCIALETIELLSATSIGYVAFNGCSALKSANLPEVQTIDGDIFNYCTELTTVKLPKVESVGTWQFSTCSSLTTLELATASTITSFGSYGFRNINTANINLTIGSSNSGIDTASSQWTPVGNTSPFTFASITAQ